VLADLVLPDGLGQALPLLLVLAPRLGRLHVLGFVQGQRRRVAQLDLAIMIAHHDVVLWEGGRLGHAALELPVVAVLVLVLPVVVVVMVLVLRVGVQVQLFVV
jgi:hypothetical protein